LQKYTTRTTGFAASFLTPYFISNVTTNVALSLVWKVMFQPWFLRQGHYIEHKEGKETRV